MLCLPVLAIFGLQRLRSASGWAWIGIFEGKPGSGRAVAVQREGVQRASCQKLGLRCVERPRTLSSFHPLVVRRKPPSYKLNGSSKLIMHTSSSLVLRQSSCNSGNVWVGLDRTWAPLDAAFRSFQGDHAATMLTSIWCDPAVSCSWSLRFIKFIDKLTPKI